MASILLGKEHRDLVRKYYAHGLKHNEIGALTGRSRIAITQLISRMRREEAEAAAANPTTQVLGNGEV